MSNETRPLDDGFYKDVFVPKDLIIHWPILSPRQTIEQFEQEQVLTEYPHYDLYGGPLKLPYPWVSMTRFWKDLQGRLIVGLRVQVYIYAFYWNDNRSPYSFTVYLPQWQVLATGELITRFTTPLPDGAK